MVCSLSKLVIIAPLLVMGSYACASDTINRENQFNFAPAQPGELQFTRSSTERLNLRSMAIDSTGQSIDGREPLVPTRQTEFSFKLKPKWPDFSRKGAFGFDLFKEPHLDVRSRLLGPARLNDTIPELNDGLEYSAGVKIEHEEADIDGTAYVSSSLLGLSYGRLGRLWYGGIDVNLEKFADTYYSEGQSDVLSLDVTTGRRLSFTGLTSHSPLWLLSVQGNFDIHSESGSDESEYRGDWYLNPSLFWQRPGFTFSAQMQVPIEFETFDDKGEPDYRLRAVFEKQFK